MLSIVSGSKGAEEGSRRQFEFPNLNISNRLVDLH